MHISNTLSLIFLSALLIFSSVSQARSMDWKLQHIETTQPVTEILQLSSTRLLLKSGAQWYQAHWCGLKLCLKATKTPRKRRPPKGGMADGGVAAHQSPGLVSAWYSQPTRRYDHGILGDRIEGGSLSAKDHKGKLYTYKLSTNEVFEDLTPRLVDLNGDGRAEIVTIRSFLDAGASLAVFALRKNKLQLIASTPPIGIPHRWLNIAGIQDLNGDGSIDIATVVTPHIGGTLKIWSFSGSRLIRTTSAYGFSNHFIGSRNLDLSAIGDVNADGKPDIAIPDAARHQLRIMTLSGGKLEQTGIINLPASIVENIGLLHHPSSTRSAYLLGLSNGALIATIN